MERADRSMATNDIRGKDRPHLCFLCFSEGEDGAGPGGHSSQAIGAVVCKQDVHRGKLNRGYIAMLTTKKEARKKGIGTRPSVRQFPESFLTIFLFPLSFFLQRVSWCRWPCNV
jgi:hypothetical protein